MSKIQEAEERLGLRPGDAVHYGAALWHWAWAGFPTRTDAEVMRIEELCRSNVCGQYVAGRCKLCGCRLNNGPALMNKIRMATENCPAGHWNEPTSTIVPFDESGDLTMLVSIYQVDCLPENATASRGLSIAALDAMSAGRRAEELLPGAKIIRIGVTGKLDGIADGVNLTEIEPHPATEPRPRPQRAPTGNLPPHLAAMAAQRQNDPG